MKKTRIYVTALISALMLLSGCGLTTPASPAASSAPDKTEAIPFTETQLYAVAWVGYDDLTELPFYLERYVDSDSVPTHYLSGGDYYLIIPRYPDMELKLYRHDISLDEPDLVYEDHDCRPFLLQCNVSDIFADATVSLTYGEETTEFSPYLSLKDGSLQIGERGLDLTK